MIIGEVVGNVWATRKDETLNGLKLLVVQGTNQENKKIGDPFVAADSVGAGFGDQVLIVKGSAARKVLGKEALAIDATIVGIIDEVEGRS